MHAYIHTYRYVHIYTCTHARTHTQVSVDPGPQALLRAPASPAPPDQDNRGPSLREHGQRQCMPVHVAAVRISADSSTPTSAAAAAAAEGPGADGAIDDQQNGHDGHR